MHIAQGSMFLIFLKNAYVPVQNKCVKKKVKNEKKVRGGRKNKIKDFSSTYITVYFSSTLHITVYFSRTYITVYFSSTYITVYFSST